MGVWNFEPSDPLLLQVIMKYSVQLSNAHDTRLAISILKRAINNAQEHLDANPLTDKTPIEVLIKDLNNSLKMYTDDQKAAEYIEVLMSEMMETQFQDDENLSRRG